VTGEDNASPDPIFPKAKTIFQNMELILRAVDGNWSIGRPRMFRIPLDGLDHEVEFVGAVDLAGDAIVAIRRDLASFGEVVQAIDSACGVVSHEEHNTGAVFGPGYEGEMIGAEVEHDEKEGAGKTRPPSAAPLRGYPGGLLRTGYHHSAAPA
jgi:hypothetical protein